MQTLFVVFCCCKLFVKFENDEERFSIKHQSSAVNTHGKYSIHTGASSFSSAEVDSSPSSSASLSSNVAYLVRVDTPQISPHLFRKKNKADIRDPKLKNKITIKKKEGTMNGVPTLADIVHTIPMPLPKPMTASINIENTMYFKTPRFLNGQHGCSNDSCHHEYNPIVATRNSETVLSHSHVRSLTPKKHCESMSLVHEYSLVQIPEVMKNENKETI